MTDDQFDEICRGSLDFEPGRASASTWSRIRPTRGKWFPTVPEILACGCACGFVLVVFAVQFDHNPSLTADSNPLVRRAMGGSSMGLQVSTFQVPDTTPWIETSLAFPTISGTWSEQGR
jgi:hypothetical protein